MPIQQVDINELTSVGGIQDEPPYQLPPEAWSLTNNVRILDGGIRRLFGWTPIFGSPLSQGPRIILYVSSAAQPWWLWASLTSAFVWNGATNTDITRAAGPYTANSAADWNRTLFGGIPILNDGHENPQYWALPYNVATKLQDIPNWPASTQCRVMRAFGPFLLALNVTSSGTNNPHRVLWSTEAAPGSLPGSWNVADPTVDAGQNDLPDIDSGIILDGFGLQGAFYIYKEAAVWRMRFIGGRFVFGFDTLLDTVGLLATRCVSLAGDGQHHVFVSQDDMVMHDGNTATPLLERRFKRYLFNQIDVTNYTNSFTFSNPLYDEVWFCYPSVGSVLANRALIFNWRHNKFTEADIDFQCTATGTFQSSAPFTWTTTPYTWANDPQAWFTSARRRTVIGNPTTSKILLLDDGYLRDGVGYTGTVQRTGLSLTGRKRTGEWIVDFRRRKQINRVWPKVTAGSPINVRVGYQTMPGGGVGWNGYQSFDPAAQSFVDGTLGSGRAVAIEFSSQNDFRLDGYKLDLALLGSY